MPSWNDLLAELGESGSVHDIVRRKHLAALAARTGRNVIAYYSGWLQKEIPQLQPMLRVNESDKNGFMAAIYGLDRKLGLDLVLHTPGGDVAATESLVDYLRTMFDGNIRAIVPQIAMSAGTMIACACREILMGKHSSLGPIDPQIGPGLPAHGIIEEWQRALREGKADQLRIPFWQPIIAKYPPTLIGECEKAIKWSDEVVRAWLKSGMFADDSDADAKIDKIAKELGDHALMKSHARRIPMTKARELGLRVTAIEDDDALQDAILSVHHAYIHTLTATNAVKIIENQNGVAFVSQAQVLAAQIG